MFLIVDIASKSCPLNKYFLKEIEAMKRIVPTFYLLIAFFLFSPHSFAAEEDKYPTKPITMILVYAPGGGADASAKALVEALKKELKAQIVPKFLVGGGGAVGALELSKAKPDGYTIGCTTLGAMALSPHTVGVKYNPLEDFEFFGTFMQFHVGYIVKSDSPFKNLKDLVEAARQKPEQIKFANANPGGFLGLGVAYLEKVEKVLFKNVPFPSGHGEAIAALLGGHVDFYGTNPPGLIPYIRAGQARMLASTSSMRHTDPNAPSFRELGYDFDQTSWNAVGAPKGIPANIKKRLSDAMNKAVKDPQFVEVMKKIDTPIDYHDGEEYAKMVRTYHKSWGDLLKGGYRY
jgi:tripartite-type tricarboxylate transporter receptor subunit TctC